MQKMRLSGVNAYGYHGVYAEEKQQGQQFVVDLELDIDLKTAAVSDNLEQTVNYAVLAEGVVADIETGSVDLIEALALKIARRIVVNYPQIQVVTVTVHKPQAPIPDNCGKISVELKWQRDELT
ncbi:MAG: dihydroneopterin aldolase [Propionibacteriaceae bacterium]